MRDNRVPWRAAREKRPEFFSIIFSTLTDKGDFVLDWQCGVGSFFISLFLMYLFSDVLISLYLFHFLIITFSHLFVLGGSIIACRSIQRHIVTIEADIDIFKSILLPFVSLSKNTLLSKLPHNEGRFLLLFPGRWRSAISICCVRKFVLGFYLACIAIFTDLPNCMCLCFFPFPPCAEFKMRARFVFSMRTCLQRLRRRSKSLPMLLNLPIFKQKHHPHLLVAPVFSTNKYWIV